MAVSTSGSPSRTYVVLEQQSFEDTDELFFVRVGDVESRNATNALRKAFRELRAKGYESTEATLVVIPESMWRPTPVRAAVREQVSVTVG
jgi:DNA polymerase IIIc chi subunit